MMIDFVFYLNLCKGYISVIFFSENNNNNNNNNNNILPSHILLFLLGFVT